MPDELVANVLVDMRQFPEIAGQVFIVGETDRDLGTPGTLIICYEGGKGCLSYPVTLDNETERLIRHEIEYGHSVECYGWEVAWQSIVLQSIVAVSHGGNERGLMFQSWEMN